MTNKVTFETASECLRITLPMMSQHRIPVSPPNYAVWFEHFFGTNPSLSESVNSRLNSDKAVDEDFTVALYKKYIANHDTSHIESAQATVKKIIEAVSASVDDANSEVTRYEQSLQDTVEQLSGEIHADELRELVGGLIESTQQMNVSNQSLQSLLEDNKRETESLRQELEQVRMEAKTDPLTGLANRKGFHDQLSVIEASDDYLAQPHSVIIGDIDKFKSINDNYGHIFGDKIIKVVAKAFSNLTKGKDLAARFGGEEFVIYLPDTSLENAARVADAIRSSIERGRIYNPKTKEEIRRVTISLGVTEVIHNEPIETTIARADGALYRAKEGGRNQVQIEPAQPTMVATG